jgi:hypothetical protein
VSNIKTLPPTVIGYERNMATHDYFSTEFGSLFKGAVGALPALTEYCEHIERKRRQGAANCQRWLCA